MQGLELASLEARYPGDGTDGMDQAIEPMIDRQSTRIAY